MKKSFTICTGFENETITRDHKQAFMIHQRKVEEVKLTSTIEVEAEFG